MSSGPREASFGDGRTVVRALLASLDFRLRHACDDAPPGFPGTRPVDDARSPLELVRHIASLMATMLRAFGEEVEADASADAGSVTWHDALARAHARIARLDRAVRDGTPAAGPFDPATLVRGPLADAFTHVGQLMLLRRWAGAPVRRVSYPRAFMPPPADDEA